MSQGNPQELELPWSDGDSKFWPPAAGGSQEHYVQTVPGDDASVQWRLKLGVGIAKHLQLPDDGTTYILKEWPEGYMLFIHHRGNRRDKYLYGRENVRYRSAAEFMPHALWLRAAADTANPPPSCQCRHCLRDKGAVRGKELLSKKSASRKPTNSTALRLPPNRRSSIKSSSITHSHSSKDTTRGSQRHTLQPSIVNNQSILACVRVAAPITAPNADIDARSANAQPILHELVWCKLRRSIAWEEVAIDFWPGIIKEDIDGSNEYVLTLIGVIQNIPVSLDATVPYRAYRTEETLIRGIQRCCRGETRPRFLNLDRYLRTEMDGSRFAAVSSAFIFAVTFSEHLATVWSWSSKPNISGRGSVVAAPSQSRYALRSQRSKAKQYDVLWWGPECIKSRQLVQLKMSQDVIFMNEDVSAAPTNRSAGSEGPVFLQIHSISYWPKPQRMRRSLAGPVVAGMIFELTDEHQHDQDNYQDLPPPPHGKVFRPLLKEGYEIVLPVTVLSGRYYCEIDPSSILNDNSTPGVHSKLLAGTGCVKHYSITPTTFCATRAKMVEHAYESGQAQALRMMAQSGDL